MAVPPGGFSREEVLSLACSAAPTDPAALDWAPIFGPFGGTVRLRMSVTEATISEELVTAFRFMRYPDVDVPEIRGLIHALVAAAERTGIPLQTAPGPRALQTGMVGSFQPIVVQWPFTRAKLSLAVAPGEIQWVLKDARKEKGGDVQRLDGFRWELLEGTRAWIRNGNR